MNLTIFGATGMVGKQLVQQCLFKGYHVRAFGRNVYTTDFIETTNLELFKGALFDEADVRSAIKGSAAVLSAIGGGFDGVDKTRSLGMKNIITQMQQTDSKRIVALGNMGVLNSDENTLIVDTEDFPPEYVPVAKEHQAAWELLLASSLDWTFVCAPDIINAGPTGIYQTNADYPPKVDNPKINAGDLAMFMINEMEKREFVKMRVGISN